LLERFELGLQSHDVHKPQRPPHGTPWHSCAPGAARGSWQRSVDLPVRVDLVHQRLPVVDLVAHLLRCLVSEL
jgi:hypothetical protein